MVNPEFPEEFLDNIEDEDQLASRMARYETLKELGAFGMETMIRLSVVNAPGTFNGRVRKSFSGRYGNTRGCSNGDIENAALVAGVFDDLYDYEIRLINEQRDERAT